MMSRKIKSAIYKQVELVDEVLTRYTNDEAGENSKEQYDKMTLEDKFNLLTNTLISCADWCEFETELVVNFDYGNY